MADEKIGIDDLSDVVVLLCELGNAAGKSAEDGKITLSDAANLTGAVMAVPAAVIGFTNVGKQLMDLDADEKAKLNALVQEKLDLPQDKVESIVEEIVKQALGLSDLIKNIAALKKGN